MQRYLLLGTAGHIDHGKTALIRALTGVDTDRLPEEKRRGITVDLGFAALDLENLSLGIIDVPGHERFIKNMLAGATGIDMALLVVAADEGVMPQTREHFEALRYLGISAGVVALTKADLVDDRWIELIQEDVSQLVANSFLQNAPIVSVSAKTGQGLAELRTKLAEAARQVPEQNTDGPFKLSIDRCFSAPGHGTIVTGSVASGQIACGEKLQLLPQNIFVNVRNLESHGKSLTNVCRGQRAALNLTGVHFRDITRGNLLATPGSLVPSRLLSVNIEASRFRERPLKSRTPVRFYTGATETVGCLRLLETKSLAPGESQIGQIELQQPVCTTWQEPFVLRGLAANEVIGGGQIVDPCAYRVSTTAVKKIDAIRDLLEGDEPSRVAAIAALAGANFWTLEELAQRTGVPRGAAVVDHLVESGRLHRFDLKGSTRWIHKDVVVQLEARLLESLQQEHRATPLAAQIALGKIQKHFQTLDSPELLTQLAHRLEKSGHVRLQGQQVAAADWQPQLSIQQKDLLQQILEICEQAKLTPPSVGELATQLSKSVDETESLLQVAVSKKKLVRLPDKDSRDADAAQRARLYLPCSSLRHLVDRLPTELPDPAGWTISRFGEVFGLSRKFAIPWCSYLDQTGITARQGDLRKLTRSESKLP